MTDQSDHKPAANDPVDCTQETAQRAGAQQTSLNKADEDENAASDVKKDDVSEADLDEAIEESMDGSDPPAFIQP
ncbi:hypothetical protein [Blastomonas sp.]|uniref:hypothetical protein n=1 Tax=Blastomonas sp. TaxID=1909299 RepID=UPI00391B3E60